MSLPDKLTFFRLAVTPLFVLVLFVQFPGNYTLALSLFLLGMLTDYFDGLLARSRNQVSEMGKLLDPLADKILITSAFISFIGLPEIRLPAWMVIVIVSREFAITGLRLVAAGKGIILSAGRWGKHKTVSQVIAVGAILLYLCLYYDPRVDAEFYRPFLLLLVGITVVLTLISGCYYLIKNRLLLTEKMEKKQSCRG